VELRRDVAPLAGAGPRRDQAMAEDVIVCPYCQRKIPLSKALAGEIEEQVRERSEAELKKREKALREELEERLVAERKAAGLEATKKLRADLT
jgi:hypothetical protein